MNNDVCMLDIFEILISITHAHTHKHRATSRLGFSTVTIWFRLL